MLHPSLPLTIALVAVTLTGCSANQPTEGDAVYYCEMRVQDNLNRPSSAKFPYPEAVGAYPSWTVTGVVDSEDASGEPIRREYQCEIVFGGAGGYNSSLNYLRWSPRA